MVNDFFKLEEHPLRGCILYLIFAFIAQVFIDNPFYAMCVVDMLTYLFVYARRRANPMKKRIYTVSTWITSFLTAGCLVITTYCWSRWYMLAVADASSVKYAASMSEANILVYMFMISIAAPLGEESLFRYIVLNGFMYKFRNMKTPVKYTLSILLSAVLFAVMHGTGVHMIVGLFCGLALAIVYCTTNKLWLSILVHSVYNVGTLFVYVPASISLCITLTIISLLLVGICIYNLSYCQLVIPE